MSLKLSDANLDEIMDEIEGRYPDTGSMVVTTDREIAVSRGMDRRKLFNLVNHLAVIYNERSLKFRETGSEGGQ